jgi:two-component system LytT family response regulator
MQKIRSIIVDDEPGNVVTLTELLKSFCPLVIIEGVAENPVSAEALILKVEPDLVFLDIEMPFGNAFTLLDKLQPVSFEIIFITAYNDYAIRAFKYSALDYLLKPVNIQELKNAVERSVMRLEVKNINTRVAALLANINSNKEYRLDKIGLPTREGFHFENLDCIMFMEAEGSYTNVYLTGNRREIVSRTLNYFDEILPPSTFCRVHHSHIINFNYVKKYFKGRGGYVEMDNGSMIEISARKKDDFLNKFVH